MLHMALPAAAGRPQTGDEPEEADMVTNHRPDVVVAWEIVVVEERPESWPPNQAVGAVAAPQADHCPACTSHSLEGASNADAEEVRCLSCGRVWDVRADGLHLRPRNFVEP
jgi:hypothetical protein